MSDQCESDFLFARDALGGSDPKRAIEIFQKLVDENTRLKADAAYVLGMAYDAAIGVQQDQARAEIYFKIAENENYSLATFRLASMYGRLGQFEKALAGFKRTAGDNPSAAFWTYMLLTQHEELNERKGEAEEYLALAIKQGHLRAKRIAIVERIKGRKGVTQIFSGIFDWVFLLFELRTAILKKEEFLYQ